MDFQIRTTEIDLNMKINELHVFRNFIWKRAKYTHVLGYQIHNIVYTCNVDAYELMPCIHWRIKSNRYICKAETKIFQSSPLTLYFKRENLEWRCPPPQLTFPMTRPIFTWSVLTSILSHCVNSPRQILPSSRPMTILPLIITAPTPTPRSNCRPRPLICLAVHKRSKITI